MKILFENKARKFCFAFLFLSITPTVAQAEVVQGEKAHATTHAAAVSFAQSNARAKAYRFCDGRGGAINVNTENPICYEGKSYGLGGWWCSVGAAFECRK